MFGLNKIDTDKKILGLVPAYGLVPLLLTPAFNMLIYFGTKPVTDLMKPHNITMKIDSYIPQIQWWMIIYVLAFATWIVGYILLAREDRDVCYEVFVGENIAKVICFIVFLTFPTTMDPPVLQGTGFIRWLSNFIYTADNSFVNPSHLLPSIHCLESWVLFRASLRSKVFGKGYVAYSFIAAILVCASTVLVKQHVLIDVVTGILVVEFGLFMSKKFKLSRFYYKLEEIIFRSKS